MKTGRVILILLLVAVVLGAALALILPRDLDLHLGQSGRPEQTGSALTACGILHEPEFGGVYLKSTI